ncbi:MAG: PAS domain S-box protein [Ilumatobacter sp.]
MTTSGLGGSDALEARDTAFRREFGHLTSPPETPLYLHGDMDADAARVFVRYVETGIKETTNRIDVRLDGVTFFGAAAAEAVERVVFLAEQHGRDLTIGGFSPIAHQVLDVLGFDHPMLEHDDPRSVPLSPVVFDAVISKAVLRSREAVCVTTHDIDDPKIVFVNESFTTLTGYAADQALGMNPKELQGPLTDRGVIESLKSSLRSSQPFNGEAVNYREDGSPFWMNWKIVEARVGMRRFYVALQRDGTDLRQLRLLQAARSRIERSHTLLPGADLAAVLDALADSISLVIESPVVSVTAAVTAADGSLVTSTSNVENVDRSLFSGRRTRRTLRDDEASLHLPFELHDGIFGHVRLDDLHPDWLRLVNDQHLTELTSLARPALIDRLPALET